MCFMCRFNSFSPGQKAIHVGITRGFMKTPGFRPSLRFRLNLSSQFLLEVISFELFPLQVVPQDIITPTYPNIIQRLLLRRLLYHKLFTWSSSSASFHRACYQAYNTITQRQLHCAWCFKPMTKGHQPDLQVVPHDKRLLVAALAILA